MQAQTAVQSQTQEERKFRKEAQRRKTAPEGREGKSPSITLAKVDHISLQ